MGIVGVLLDRYCRGCDLDSTAEITDDLGDVVMLMLACCDTVEEVPHAEINELLVDCD
jgi:hypothetical protein